MTIEDLLRETFASHESLADSARAQEIARTTARRARWWPAVVAAAAVVVLVAGGAAYLSLRGGDDAVAPSPPAASATTGSATVDGGHKDLVPRAGSFEGVTRAEAARLLHALPLPRGSIEHTTSPIPALQHGYVGTSTGDARLGRTTWWTVPVSDSKFSSWLSQHRPAGTQVDEMGVDSSHSNYAGRDVRTTIYSGAATTAWGPTTVVVTHASYRGETAVRIDVEIAARFARTAATLAGQHVTRVDITRTMSGAGPLQNRSVSVTDHDAVAALSFEFDHILGALDTPGMVTGGLGVLLGTQIATYDVTFTSAGSRLTATWQVPDGSGVPTATLSRDGQELTTTLDVGVDGSAGAFESLVTDALGS